MNAPNDARHIARNVDPRQGFTVGWDYASYGIPLPRDIEKDVLEGHLAGTEHFGHHTLKHDRFVRKWLQLRLNAWRRGRVFDQDVTPAYLKSITPSHCPVTRQILTVATGADTDWSVDRIVNNGGYAPGNLVVMSARANLAKDSMDYAQILRVVATKEAHAGLSHLEWARLAAIAGMVEDTESLLPLLATPPIKMTVANPYTMLQMATMFAGAGVIDRNLASDIRQACAGKKAKKAFDTYLDTAVAFMMRKRRRGAVVPPHELYWLFADVWQDGVLMDLFRAWIDELPPDGTLRCVCEAAKHVTGIKRTRPEARDAWSENTRGYVAYA